MSEIFRQQLQQEFDIPAPVATWVLLTHFFVLAVPLAVIWAVDVYASQLAFAHPTMIKLASAVYIGATAFEVAQNSADRWYLTEATRSVADLFFNSFMTLAFCLYTIGFYSNIWMTSVALILTVLYPLAYINNHASHRALNGIVVLLGTVSLFLVTGDPTAFLFLVVNFFAVYLIVLLTQNHAQWLHGWAAFFFGLAFLAWPWAIVNAANGEPKSWLFVGGVTVAIVGAAALLTPLMKKMTATPRVHAKA
ncbi:MAG: hypothetical protein ACR2P6_08935 [Gammaproteobacteria bacterium]